MKSQIQFLIYLFFFSVLSNLNATSVRLTERNYLTFHYDIKEAMEVMDFKKAKSLVQSLMPMLDSDIAYTKAALEEEEDEHFIKDLTSRIKRQKEIRLILKDFLNKKKKNLGDFSSLDVIKELRRLSIKPKAQ